MASVTGSTIQQRVETKDAASQTVESQGKKHVLLDLDKAQHKAVYALALGYFGYVATFAILGSPIGLVFLGISTAFVYYGVFGLNAKNIAKYTAPPSKEENPEAVDSRDFCTRRVHQLAQTFLDKPPEPIVIRVLNACTVATRLMNLTQATKVLEQMQQEHRRILGQAPNSPDIRPPTEASREALETTLQQEQLPSSPDLTSLVATARTGFQRLQQQPEFISLVETAKTEFQRLQQSQSPGQPGHLHAD